jgi:proline iminopeptidase
MAQSFGFLQFMEDDPMAVPKMMVKYKEYCPKAKSIMFQKSEDNPQVEEPSELFPLLKDFLYK